VTRLEVIRQEAARRLGLRFYPAAAVEVMEQLIDRGKDIPDELQAALERERAALRAGREKSR
jgi:hypothetical protein